MFQIYTTFYCRINEPSYIKHLKLDILAAIADETNAYDIATELTEYVNDIDEKLARKAIRTVGKIALEVNCAARRGHGTTLHMSCLATAAAWIDLAGYNLLTPICTSFIAVHAVPSALCCMAINARSGVCLKVQDVPGLVERLLGFLDIGKDFVTAETIVQVKDLARKYPDIAEVCVGSISNISLEVCLALSIQNECMAASALCHARLASQQALFLFTGLLAAGTLEAIVQG